MKKNEQQPQETAAVAADAPAAQENEAAAQQPAQTEESAPDAGGEIAVADDGPIDENQDPTFVPVTVLVVATSAANNYLLLRHCLRPLQKNLRGVDAQVKVVGAERPDWLDCESWLSDAAGEFNHLNELVARALPHVETNRVILMTDRMLLARPVTLADIALMKALPEGGDLPTLKVLAELLETEPARLWNYQTHMPLYAFRKPLLSLLRTLSEIGHEDLHLPTAYNNAIYSSGMLPTLLDWATDQWLLPVVSAHPSMERMKAFLVKKKFIWISPNSEGAEVVALLKFLTPDAAPCETDCPNANPAQD